MSENTIKRQRGIYARFLSFSEARAFVHALSLPNITEYQRWARGDHGLKSIPVNPNLVYAGHEWQGWIDWLGPSYRQSKKPFLSYEDAKTFAHTLHLSGKAAFDKWAASSERATNIPACPHLTYKNVGWQSWQEFLGHTGRKRGRCHFLPFQEARAWVHAQQLANTQAWLSLRTQKLLPHNIPTSPSVVYQNKGWISWRDWLGNPPKKERWRPFEEARNFARSLQIRNAPTYKKWAMTSARPWDMPAAPHLAYRGRGWVDWYDWLGHSTNQMPRHYLSFDEARAFVREQNLVGFSGWAEWCRNGFRPKNIPSSPSTFYRRQGWEDWKDFLGSAERFHESKQKRKQWRSFPETRQLAHSLNLWKIEDWKEWAATSARPDDVPEKPDYVYRNEGWAGWRDFLGKISLEDNRKSGAVSRRWRGFEEAKKYVRSLGFASIDQWKQWADSSEKPYDIPKTPHHAYRNQGWAGMSDWLGLELHKGRPKALPFNPYGNTPQLLLEGLFD